MKRSTVISSIVGIVILAVIVGAVFKFVLRSGGGAGAQLAGFEPMESVQVVDAREVTWQPTADLVGTVFAIRSVTVRNELPGVVRFVGFESGSIVEPGQVLLKQDDSTDLADLAAAKASVRVAEANVARAETDVRLAEQELERMTSVQSRAVAEMDVDRSRARRDSAATDRMRYLAEVDQAKAAVAQVEARLAKLTVTAPFRARAAMRTVHEGQYLAQGSDVVALQELTDKIYLDFAIPQQYVSQVAIGTTVMATGELLGPKPVGIEVVAVDAAVNNDTRNLRVRSIVENPNGSLVPGMFVQVRVPIGVPSPSVVVPSTAIRRAAYANSVFVIEPDEKGDGVRAKQRFVQLGETLGEDVIVLEGLKVGDRIAAAGSFKLRDGVKVMLAPPAGAASADASK